MEIHEHEDQLFFVPPEKQLPEIPEDLEKEPVKVDTKMYVSDITSQKISATEAGLTLLGKIELLFIDAMQETGAKREVVAEVTNIFDSHRDVMEKKLEELKKAKAQTPSQKLGLFQFIARWKEKTNLEKEINKEIERAIIESTQHMISRDPAHGSFSAFKNKLMGDSKFSSNVFNKTLSKEFSVLTQYNRGKVQESKNRIYAKFKLKIGNSGYQITDEANRVQPTTHLLKAIDAKLERFALKIQTDEADANFIHGILRGLSPSELQGVFSGHYPKKIQDAFEENGYIFSEENSKGQLESLMKEIVEKLTQDDREEIIALMQEKSKLETVGENAWRTSGEAQIASTSRLTEDIKSNFSVNAWIENVTAAGRSFFIARSGAFTDFSDSSINISQLNEGSEAYNKRAKLIRDEAMPVLTENILRKVEELEANPDPYIYTKNDNPEICLTQFSLLNDSGKELNMVKDMEWLFQKIDGKEVILDGNTGFDEEGNLHMPKKMITEEGAPHRIKINANFYNLKVQGSLNPKNDPTQNQYAINEKAWARTQERCKKYGEWLRKQRESFPLQEEQYQALLDLHIRKWAECALLIQNNKSNYEINRAIAELEQGMGSAVGVSCKSGKDRTSYLVGELKRNFVKKTILPETNEKDHQQVKLHKNISQEIDRKVMENDVGTHIAGMNTGVNVLKLKKIFMFGTSILNRLGKALMATQVKT